MLFRDQWTFTRAWLRNPVKVSAVAPSSRALAAAMAVQVPLDGQVIVELGGGTGSITAGLLRAGVEPENLYVVERDAYLSEALRLRFPDVRILKGDATRLPGILANAGLNASVGAVVSSLPLLSMGPDLQRRILCAAMAVTEAASPIIQFSYGLKCPIPDKLLTALDLRAQRMDRVWRNLPPAAVWRLERRSRTAVQLRPIRGAAALGS
ncbi:MAG: hypothetical protein KDH88_10325 [Chromatiales bacterium]|nr:hypothetical protein [Chromatiales bacterium]